jgi:hypothetical protein
MAKTSTAVRRPRASNLNTSVADATTPAPVEIVRVERVEGVDLSFAKGNDEEALISHRDLAEMLELDHHNVAALAERLKSRGYLGTSEFFRETQKKSGRGQPAVTVYFTEEQALVIASQSGSRHAGPLAWKMACVFKAWRHGRLAPMLTAADGYTALLDAFNETQAAAKAEAEALRAALVETQADVARLAAIVGPHADNPERFHSHAYVRQDDEKLAELRDEVKVWVAAWIGKGAVFTFAKATGYVCRAFGPQRNSYLNIPILWADKVIAWVRDQAKQAPPVEYLSGDKVKRGRLRAGASLQDVMSGQMTFEELLAQRTGARPQARPN